MIGPVVKIDPADLPRRPNIHWLGAKSYAELPAFMAHWDMGWMPFALNEATRYISPTKTPEFLAAGLPVVSTAIVDVVRTYGALGLVQIADADDIEEKIREALGNPKDLLRNSVDAYLATMSWDQTWKGMSGHIARAVKPRVATSASAWGRDRDVRLADRRRRLRRQRAGGADRLAAGRVRPASSTGATTSAATPMTATMTRASSSTVTDRTSSTPTGSRSSTTCRSSPNGAPMSTGCWRRSTASCCRSRSTSTPSTGSTAST